jgi:hypothetical protein
VSGLHADSSSFFQGQGIEAMARKEKSRTRRRSDWPSIHDREIVEAGSAGSGRTNVEKSQLPRATVQSSFKVRDEGFSLRELMQALKLFDGSPGQLPEEVLVRCFERYYRSFLGQPELISRTAEVGAIST